MISFLTDITVDGVALWVVLLICVGVFLGAFMDAIAGGGGIITVPAYLMASQTFPFITLWGRINSPPASARFFPQPGSSIRDWWTGSSLPRR